MKKKGIKKEHIAIALAIVVIIVFLIVPLLMKSPVWSYVTGGSFIAGDAGTFVIPE